MNKLKFLGSISLPVLLVLAINGFVSAPASESGQRIVAIAANRY